MKKVSRERRLLIALGLALAIIVLLILALAYVVCELNTTAFTDTAETITEPTTVPTTEQTTETTDATVPTNNTDPTDATVPTQSTEPTTGGFLLSQPELPYWLDPQSIFRGKLPDFLKDSFTFPNEKGIYVEGKRVTFGDPTLEEDGFTVSYKLKYTDNWAYLTGDSIPDDWWIF